ncbi:hypothetical protein QP028_15005 [Corynebacterium suedekumii]|nr:hypothetical protein QP028_15005 [Corynebacterium suedekumii]
MTPSTSACSRCSPGSRRSSTPTRGLGIRVRPRRRRRHREAAGRGDHRRRARAARLRSLLTRRHPRISVETRGR